MSKTQEFYLGDLFNISSGGTPSRKHNEYYENGDIPWIKTGDLKHKYLYEAGEYITEDGIKNSSAKMYPVDTVLLAMYGATIGACSILKIPAATNQACAAFVKNEKVLPDYLYLYLESKKQFLVKAGVGGAQPNISATFLKCVKIPLPPLEEQKKIAEILNKASNLISIRKKQIEKLDLLVKAEFVEMFGADENNSATELQEVCNKITDGTHQSPHFVDKGIPFLFVSNIVDNKINYATSKFITKEEYEILMKRTPIEIGDVLLTIVGSYGNPAVVESMKEFCFQRHIAYLKPDQRIINSYYLHSALQSPYVKRQIEEKVKGIAQKTLNLSELKIIKVNLPSIILQNQFAAFVEQVEQQKAKLQQGLEKLELNYKALMQQYFG